MNGSAATPDFKGPMRYAVRSGLGTIFVSNFIDVVKYALRSVEFVERYCPLEVHEREVGLIATVDMAMQPRLVPTWKAE